MSTNLRLTLGLMGVFAAAAFFVFGCGLLVVAFSMPWPVTIGLVLLALAISFVSMFAGITLVDWGTKP